MKAVISSTYDDQYLFFFPIVTWCWNKLGVDVMCFLPQYLNPKLSVDKYDLISRTLWDMKGALYFFNCPEDKEATYSQCSRLYAAAFNLPEDEMLITSDVDMAVFTLPPSAPHKMTVWGSDLTPESQFPMCYISGPVRLWRETFGIGERYTGLKTNGNKWPKLKKSQERLDELLGSIECDNMRGNYWGKDQEEAFNRINEIKNKQQVVTVNRARPGTQFASHRVDRDDINWRSYCGPDLVDAHLWRPGYTDTAFANILELLSTQYPNDDFQWLITYRNEYIRISGVATN